MECNLEACIVYLRIVRWQRYRLHAPSRKKTGINVDHVVNVINADIISRVIVLIIIVTVIIIGPVVSKPGDRVIRDSTIRDGVLICIEIRLR